MKITLEMVKKLNPCATRLDNAIKYYGKKDSITSVQLMGLKNITQKETREVLDAVLKLNGGKRELFNKKRLHLPYPI